MAVQSVQAIDGMELRLPCKVTGKPMPQVSWYHNGKNIDQDEEYVITYNPEEGDIGLLIVEVFPEDEGEYVCVAHNPAGDAVTRATLVVMEPQQMLPTKAVVEETEVLKVIDVECVPESQEIDEDEVKPDVIERPKLVPMVETPRSRSPSPEEEEVVSTPAAQEQELQLQIQEELVQPKMKPKTELKVGQEPMEVTEEDVQPGVIERPKLVPMEERPRSPSPEMEEFVPASVVPVQEDLAPEVEEETVQPVKKVKPEHKIGQEPAEIREDKVTPDVIERPKLVPLEETRPRSLSPDFFDTVELQRTVKVPETEELKPEVSEEVLEQELKPKVIDRPKPKSIIEETARPDSPVYEEIGEAPIYEEIPERPPPVAEEEIMEPSVKQSKIDRPKPKSIVAEETPEEPDFEEVVTLVKDQPEETGVVATEETIVSDQVTKELELPEMKPRDERLDKQLSKEGEEAPRPKEEIHVEDIYQTIDEAETVEEIAPEFIELIEPQIAKDGDRVLLKCKVVGIPTPTITWFREGQEIVPSSDFQPGYDMSTGICSLEIPEVFPEDAGEYACRAVNPFGECVTTANLLVEGKLTL